MQRKIPLKLVFLINVDRKFIFKWRERGDLVECPYCGQELQCIDYYGHTRYSEHYWIYPHSWIEKEGDIYQCQNESCESQIFNGYFYDRCDGNLREGYPC